MTDPTEDLERRISQLESNPWTNDNSLWQDLRSIPLKDWLWIIPSILGIVVLGALVLAGLFGLVVLVLTNGLGL